MSQAAAAAGSGGGMRSSGGENPEEDKNWKGVISNNIPDSPVMSSDEESDDEQSPATKVGGGGGKSSTLDCMAALEASLPMKRGISRNYSGKSKSYVNLSAVAGVMEDARDLGKKEHAVNKRRRLIIAHEYPDRVTAGGADSAAVTHASSSPAILPLRKDEEEGDGGCGGADSQKK
ncbi:hypothetical protein ACP275_01G043700 [Erythranthe tilingii]